MVFQEPMTALDPVYTVRSAGIRVRAKRGAAAPFYSRELSGGLRQRMVIAMALACRPRLLLADGPTAALDATVQIQIPMLRSLKRELDMGMVLVTHDLGVASEIADWVVMYAGQVVEQGPVRDVLRGG